MKNISLVLFILSGVLMSGCRIYSTYERPGNLPVDSLYRDVSADSVASADTTSLGDMPWQQFFQDEHLRELISYGLSNNTDMLTALLRVDQAEAQLKAAKLAFLPSLTLSPQGSLSSVDGGKPAKTYELPIEASWEVDLFGSLRNAKKSSQTTLLQQKAYQQAVRSKLIAMIAIDYYALLSIDSQIEISLSTLNVWREQVRTIEALLKVGEENENALTQARAGRDDACCCILFHQSGPFGFLSQPHSFWQRRLDQFGRTDSVRSRQLDSLGFGFAHAAYIQPRQAGVKPACCQGRGADSLAQL